MTSEVKQRPTFTAGYGQCKSQWVNMAYDTQSHFIGWRALARQHPILYTCNSEKKAKSVECKVEDMRSRLCFFTSGHSGVPVNARGNIDQFRAIVPALEIKDTINEVKYGCL